MKMEREQTVETSGKIENENGASTIISLSQKRHRFQGANI